MIAAAVSWVRRRLLVTHTAARGEPGEDGGLRAIARKVQLAIDAAAMVHRRVPDPPEAGCDLAHFAAAVSNIMISPICWKAPSTSPV